MKMMYIHIAILAYFFTDTLNWQVRETGETFIKYFLGKI